MLARPIDPNGPDPAGILEAMRPQPSDVFVTNRGHPREARLTIGGQLTGRRFPARQAWYNKSMVESNSSGVDSLFRAADAPATKRLLDRRRLVCRAVIAAGLVLIVVGFVIRNADDNRRAADASGRDPSAVITSIVPHIGGTGPSSSSVTLTFHTADGTEHSASLMLDRAATPYHAGTIVTVLYDVDNPSHLSILGEPIESGPVPWFIASVLGAVLVLVGVAASTWLRWARQVLEQNPWVAVRSKVIEKPMRDGGRRVILRVLELHGAPDDATLAAPHGWRARSLDDLAPVAWVAGSERSFLVAAPGGTPLRRFRRVRLIGDEAEPMNDAVLRSRHTTRG